MDEKQDKVIENAEEISEITDCFLSNNKGDDDDE
jgi:hypothetical protein